MVKHTWNNIAYKNPKEDIPADPPITLGKRIILMNYFGANLMHDVLSGKVVTGIVHFYNKIGTVKSSLPPRQQSMEPNLSRVEPVLNN